MMYTVWAFLVGWMLLQAARAENQQPLTLYEDELSGPIIGIDLGMGYSRVSIARDGKFEVLTDDSGKLFLSQICRVQLC